MKHLTELLDKVWTAGWANGLADGQRNPTATYAIPPSPYGDTGTDSDIKYIDIGEFVEQGYLHETNRLVLHPTGLALEVQSYELAGETYWFISGVWDARDDAEGMLFGEVNQDKVKSVQDEADAHADERKAVLGEAGYVEAYDGFIVQERSLTSDEVEVNPSPPKQIPVPRDGGLPPGTDLPEGL